MSDGALFHAFAALSAFFRLSTPQKSLNSHQLNEDDKRNRTAMDLNRHRLDAIRLLNKKLESPKDALSVNSLVTAALLTACAVSLHIS